MRHKVTLLLNDQLNTQFKALQQTLGHDEPEETFRVLLNLGILAVSLTTKEKPMLELCNSAEPTRRGGYDFGKGAKC